MGSTHACVMWWHEPSSAGGAGTPPPLKHSLAQQQCKSALLCMWPTGAVLPRCLLTAQAF